MKLLTKYISVLTLIIAVFSCQERDFEPLADDVELRRMPFNERVFLLDSRGGESRIFEVDYDFQGLADEAVLRKLPHEKIPGGGHMTMSPDNRYLTVVAANRGIIYLVDIESGDVRQLLMYRNNEKGLSDGLENNINGEKFTKMKITQVDVDQDGYLFLAGKSGFFKVVADNDRGSDIWYDTDEDLNGTAQEGKVVVHTIPFKFSGDAYVETTEDGEDYFEDDLKEFNPKKVRFNGGDILFTQNAKETDGFESQRLISFSQWRGNIAIALDLNFDWDKKEVSFTASQLFGTNRHPLGKNYKIDGVKTERVTGAALTGDNFVFTSHHKRDYLNLWNLHGDLVKRVKFTFEGEPFKGGNKLHHWGDMASSQYFDKNTSNPNGASNKEIGVGEGHYFAWYKGDKPGHQYAEIKLYRPGSGMQKDPQNLSEAEYNDSKDSRPNAANADIADYRRNAKKFVALGKNGGYALFRLSKPVVVTENTTLQIVETTWNRKAQFDNINDAFKSYPEKANVFVLKGETPRYYFEGLEKHVEHDWAFVGKASVANNEFELADVANGNGGRDHLVGEEIQWIMIRDKYSTSPDGFDINFISVYENE